MRQAVLGLMEGDPMLWVSSEGGPLLLLPKSALDQWDGCTARHSGAHVHPESDYQRACKIRSYIGLIRVGTVEAVVLGEPMQTTWSSSPAHPGMLVQWMYADDERDVVHYLETLPDSLDSDSQ